MAAGCFSPRNTASVTRATHGSDCRSAPPAARWCIANRSCRRQALTRFPTITPDCWTFIASCRRPANPWASRSATAAIAEDTEHQFVPKGLAKSSPMGGLTLNAMVFKHSPYPNAAKAFLQFMLEKDQYEPWLNANSGYWSQPLAAYADAAVWSQDPKVKLFKDTMKNQYWNGYKGPISTATGAVNADYVLVQMCASVATDAATPEAAAAEAERRAKRYFRR